MHGARTKQWNRNEFFMNRTDKVRGKIFTDVIRKTPVQAQIRTRDLVTEGTIHVHPERRVSHELNAPQGFLAVTEAQVTDEHGTRSIPFIAVNKRHIVSLVPDDDSREAKHD